MHKRILIIALLSVVAGGVTAYATTAASAERPGCLGKIVCPLTGEPVCTDRCPLGEPSAQDRTAALPACCIAAM